jgi:hypothetical protein
MRDWFSKQQINIKFCVKSRKLSLEMKHGAFSMIPKTDNKISKETADIPMTQESSHIKMINGDNAHHWLFPLQILSFAFGIIMKALCFIFSNNFPNITQNLMLICCFKN